jgi:pyruvate carboxylase subunit B
MDQAREDTKGLAKNETDVLIAALYPVTGKRFLRWKYGIEPVPADVKPKTLEDVKREEELVKKALKGELVEPPKKEAPPMGERARTFNVFVDGEYFEVTVDDAGAAPVVQSIGKPAALQPAAQPANPAPTAVKPKSEAKRVVAAVDGAAAVSAPMPGVIINVLVKEGDTVKAGDPVVVLEAMKVENTLTAPVGGKAIAIRCAIGDSVKKGAVLVQIG